MVVAVQCPADKCRKWQMIEAADRGKEVVCLICKASIRVPAAAAAPPPPPVPKATPLPANLPKAKPL